MTPRRHRRLTQTFLVANSMFWFPWGLINLFKPTSWSGELIPGMDVYDLSSPVARTEVRAMYRGTPDGNRDRRARGGGEREAP